MYRNVSSIETANLQMYNVQVCRVDLNWTLLQCYDKQHKQSKQKHVNVFVTMARFVNKSSMRVNVGKHN